MDLEFPRGRTLIPVSLDQNLANSSKSHLTRELEQAEFRRRYRTQKVLCSFLHRGHGP